MKDGQNGPREALTRAELVNYLVLCAQSTKTDYIRAKTNFNLSPIYFACTSSNHKVIKNHKISPDTHLHKTKHTQTPTKNVQRISPFGIAPVKKKHIRLGHAGIVDHCVDLSIPDLKHLYEKGMDRGNEK